MKDEGVWLEIQMYCSGKSDSAEDQMVGLPLYWWEFDTADTARW